MSIFGTRQVTQIAVSPGDGQTSDIIYALCNDGTIWGRLSVPGREWELLPEIPQRLVDQNV